MRALPVVAIASLVVVILVLANGGDIYETTCPRTNGHMETSWSYRPFDALPYGGFPVSGCESHTAARELLSAVGVWKIRLADAATERAARAQLVTEKRRMDALDRRVDAAAHKMFVDGLRDGGVPIRPSADAYRRLADDVAARRSALGPLGDDDLRTAWRLMGKRTAVEADSLATAVATLRLGQTQKFVSNARATAMDLAVLDDQLTLVLRRINGHYGLGLFGHEPPGR